MIADAVGSSETGAQMSHVSIRGSVASGRFSPGPGTTILDEEMGGLVQAGHEGIGWLAQEGYVPLGYLGDSDKTVRTFPVVGGVRYAVPGDRARLLADGQIELLGRDAVTINSGGEKIFVEEVEGAIGSHPDVSDVVVVGRPSTASGSGSGGPGPARSGHLAQRRDSHRARLGSPGPVQAAQGCDLPRPHRALSLRKGRLSLGSHTGQLRLMRG